jgi:hypothetical protein
MSEFHVVAPCAYVIDGAAVHHREAGAYVELPSEVAAELGDAVEAVKPPPQQQPPTLHTVKPKKQSGGKDEVAGGDTGALGG